MRWICLLLALAGAANAQRDFEAEAKAAASTRDFEQLLSVCDGWVAFEDSVDATSMAHATARTYRYIASRMLGALGAAEDDARIAWKLIRELHGDESFDTITAMGNVAGVRLRRGDLLEAEALYRESLALLRRMPISGETDEMLARWSNNLAFVLLRQGSWADAEEMFRNSLELAHRIRGAEHRTTAQARQNLARSLRAQGRFSEARAQLDSALATYENDDFERIAASLMAMSEVEFEAGDYPVARELAERAHEMQRQKLGPESPDAARSTYMLGRIDLSSGRRERAETLARNSLQTLERIFGDLHPDVLRARVLLAEAELENGAIADCLRTLARATDAYESNIRSSAAGLDRATVDLPSPYPLLARAHVLARNWESAWNAAELSHAKVLSEVLDLRLGKLSDTQLRRRARLSQELQDLRSRAEDMTTSGEDFVELRRELLQREAEWTQFERELAVQQGFDARDLPKLQDIAALLGEDDLLVGWIDGFVWSLDAHAQLEWSACDQGSGAARLRAQLLQARDAPAFAPPSEDAALREMEREVGEAWFGSIWPRLQNRKRLWIIPHTELAGLPIAPLRDPEGRAFVERFEIVLLPSASVWQKASQGKDTQSSGGALFFGALPADATTHARFRNLPLLSAALTELQRCATLNPGAEILSGQAASEAALRLWNQDGRLRELDLLHFATHAVSDPMRPGRSALMAIAGDGGSTRASASIDGALSAVEIADTWELDARLVVLSACETALGRPVPGEGYVGIAHGFFQAGARSLLLSQWAVDDEATSMLMEEFYRRWREVGESSAAALAAAQRSVRARHPHPYFWAAFTLVGAAD